MKILKIFAIIVVVAIGVLLIAGLLMPSTAHVERSITIKAPASTIFEEINETGNFNNWSPWYRIDPQTSYEYEGPRKGIGAKMSWSSEHPDVGDGAQWIIESVENQKVVNQIEFGGFEGDFKGSFYLEPQGEETKVVWAYDADVGSNLIGRFFNPFMDDMLGPVYEDGLANLKEYSEGKKPKVEEVEEPTEATEDTDAQ